MSPSQAACPEMLPSTYQERTGNPPIVYDKDAPTSLPNELLEQIIGQGWNAPMHPNERTDFLTSVFLVSKKWLATLARVSSMDVYISSASYLAYYRRFVEGKSALYERALSGSSALDLCRSITRQIPLPTHRLEQVSDLRGRLCGKPMRDLLSTFHYFPYFPHLDSLAVEYHAAGPSSLSENENEKNQPVSFRVPIVQLALEYRFSHLMQEWCVDALCFSGQQNRWARQNSVPWALPFLEHVTMTEECLGEVLERCPHLEVVKEVKVEVRILASSMGMEDLQACALVHGALSQPGGHKGEENDGSTVVCGRALGFVLPLGPADAREQKIIGDPVDKLRTVHVFVRSSAL